MQLMLENDDLRRRLMLLRYDPEYHGEDNRVPVYTLAKHVGMTRQALYRVMNNPRYGFSKVNRDRLSYMFRLIDAGMRFHRRNQQWFPVMPDGSSPPGFDMMRGKTHHGVAHLFLS